MARGPDRLRDPDADRVDDDALVPVVVTLDRDGVR
jgi:hypothetical protein